MNSPLRASTLAHPRRIGQGSRTVWRVLLSRANQEEIRWLGFSKDMWLPYASSYLYALDPRGNAAPGGPIRAGFPVIERDRTVSPRPARRNFSFTAGEVSASSVVSQTDPHQTPAAPSAIPAAS